MTTIALIGTLDTKGAEYEHLRAQIHELGAETIVVDVGTGGSPGLHPDVTAAQVAQAAGWRPSAHMDRGEAVAAMGAGAAVVCRRLLADGRLDGVIALGGSGGTYIGTQAMRALPVGLPKVMVSTMTSGDVSGYVGASDICMTYSVVDIAGLNPVLRRILANAAASVVAAAQVRPAACSARPVIAASMFGITTPGVTRGRLRLDELGYDVLVFHANGTGGRSLEAMAATGLSVPGPSGPGLAGAATVAQPLAGVFDLTTTELADELVGGIFSAGPGRLDAAARAGLPQVISVGALDVVDFGPIDSLPAVMRGRTICVHNPGVTLVRTTAAECRELGALIGRKLANARGRVAVFVPLRGMSELSVKGGPFYDPDADRALLEALRETLRPSIELHELDADINDEGFALAAADRLNELVQEVTT